MMKVMDEDLLSFLFKDYLIKPVTSSVLQFHLCYVLLLLIYNTDVKSSYYPLLFVLDISGIPINNNNIINISIYRRYCHNIVYNK